MQKKNKADPYDATGKRSEIIGNATNGDHLSFSG